MHKHIISGISAAVGLREYLHWPLDGFSVFEDHLLLGPLVSVGDTGKFISERAAFWKKDDVNPRATYANFLHSSYKEFIRNIQNATSYTLWVSPGLNDQIMWAWLVQLFELFGISWKNVEIKHLFNDIENKIHYSGLGEIPPRGFSLCKDFKLEDGHLSFLKRAYAALTSNTPDCLIDICNEQHCDLPDLHEGLRDYLRLFPNAKNGLNAVDFDMLSCCKDVQRKSARVVAEGMMPVDHSYRLSLCDRYVFSRLIKMTQLRSQNPLVHIHGTVKDISSMRHTEVSITELGKEVLNGRKNYVEINGIEERIGGIHLSSKNPESLWFYKDGSLVRT